MNSTITVTNPGTVSPADQSFGKGVILNQPFAGPTTTPTVLPTTQELKNNLNLGTMAEQDSNQIDVRGGSLNKNSVLKIAAPVDSIANLRVQPSREANYLSPLSAFAHVNDGGDGNFVYDPDNTRPDDGGTVVGNWVRLGVEAMNVRQFGATGNGQTDDTDAIEKALWAGSLRNTVIRLDFPWGAYRVTRSIRLPANCTGLIMSGRPLFELGNQPAADAVEGLIKNGSIICCLEITGDVFDLTNAIETGQTVDGLNSFEFTDMVFDGANGLGPQNATTTCTGVLSQIRDQNQCSSVYVARTSIINIATPSAIALNLSRTFWAEIENLTISHIANGYGLYLVPLPVISTTISIKKIFFYRCLEAMCVGPGTMNVTADDVVFENGFVALTAFGVSSLLVRNLHIEGMGMIPGTTSHALSTKNGPGQAGPWVDTVIFNRCSNIRISGLFDLWANTVGLAGYAEINGATLPAPQYVAATGGSLTFEDCRAPDVFSVPFFSPASAPATNGGANIVVREANNLVMNDGYTFIGANVNDARCISDGLTHVLFGAIHTYSPIDIRPVRIINGRFTYLPCTAHLYSGPLTDAPAGGFNMCGDRVVVAFPQAGGYSEYVCVQDGTLESPVGVWKGCGLIQA